MLPASSNFAFIESKILEERWKDQRFPDFLCFVQVIATYNIMATSEPIMREAGLLL